MRAITDPIRRELPSINIAAGWSDLVIPGGLILVWFLVILGIPAQLPLQLASWLTFIGLLITPGYLLADLITWRMEIDWLERLALALPLGVAILAVPGIVALVLHLTISQLTLGWMVASGWMLVVWLTHLIAVRLLRRPSGNDARRASRSPWAADEIILLLLLGVAFLAILPTLSLHKIDGDAYAVGSFAADALAGLPLNASEPLFGTTLGPGVRMVFNQSLPMSYLWSHLAGIDPITHTASASRAMIALWAIMASYTLGRAARPGSHRFGLYTAAIQLLIYLAAPFVRGDNVSLFFFERINADKFMVPVTMLPVVAAFSIRYVRNGHRDAWLAAAVATFAISTIHPLVAAMLAMALGAFGAFHLLLDVKARLVRKDNRPFLSGGDFWLLLGMRRQVAWRRGLALWSLVAIVMFLPFVQLVLARGEAPLAPSYPSSFDGWPIGHKLVPILPLIRVQSLDLYGPLPDLAQLEASQATTATNPFLIWRFAVNMNRQRLILFDLNHYISDPSIILEPPYLLALLLLPLLLWRIRFDVAAQFAVSTTLAILFVMFNPILTPLIGSLVMPWILWRLVWVLPYALIIALATQRLLSWTVTETVRWTKSRRVHVSRSTEASLRTYMPLGFILVATLILSPGILRNTQNLNDRLASPYFFPTPEGILARLKEITAQTGPVTVLADQDLSVTIPAYVANASIVAHRAPTTSEVFPADQQDVALQRLIDQDTFYHTPYLTTESLDVLQRYNVQYVLTSSGSDVDLQLRLAPQWFEWLMDDQSFSLYAVHHMPSVTPAILGNSALVGRRWEDAEGFYRTALEQDPGDWLALVGLVQVAHAQGRFSEALARLQQISDQIDLPILHYRLGLLYAERGLIEESIAQLDQAQRAAPRITRFHVALGDACLGDGQDSCAAAQFEAATANEAWPDDAARLIAQADLWRRRGRIDQALPLYEQAVDLRPSEYNQFVLAGAYREAGQFDRAEDLVHALRARSPFSADVALTAAAMMAAKNKVDVALAMYRYAIWLQDIVAQETTETRLALAQTLLDANRLDQAGRQIDRLLRLSPYNASAFRLQGDLYYRQGQFEQAVDAYQRAFQLDPTQIDVYVSLSDQLRRHGGRPVEILELLRAASDINPDEATLLIALGDQLQRIGDLEAAVDVYRSALDTLDPYTLTPQLRSRPIGQSRAFAYARLARAYEDLGQLEPAMNYYKAVTTAAPDVPWTHVLLGDALRRRNDVVAADASYQRAIQHDATYVEAIVRLADLLNARGKTAEADGLYEQALQIAQSQSEFGQQAAGAIGVSSSGDGQATSSRPPAYALESDETTASSSRLAADRTTSNDSDIPAQIRQADEVVNAVGVLARLYQVHDQSDQAIQLYQQTIQEGDIQGWSPIILAQFHKGLGDVYLAQGRLDLATQAYQQAVDLDNWSPDARLALAEAFSAQGDSASALHHLRTAVDVAPGSVEAQVALARALDQQGGHDQALKIYQATARDHPGNPRATLALARALQDRSRWDEAERTFRETIDVNAGTAEAYIGLAELSIDLARYAEAETLLRQAVEVDRQNVGPFLHLFELDQRRGNPDHALVWYQQAAAMPQAGQAINATLYDSLLRYADYDTALVYVQEALQARPDDVDLLYRLAQIQRRLGRYAEADATLAEAQRLNQTDSRLYAEMAELYLAQGQPRTALVLYEQAIELQPREESYYLAASQIWAAQGRLGQALAVLQAGQTRVRQPAVLYAAMSGLQLRQGASELAMATLQQGIQDVGEDPQLLLALASYYESRGDFDQAEQHYTQALERQPYAAALRVALADIYRGRDQISAALKHYEQAVALEPANPGYHLALADAYHQAERDEEAVQAYSRALALAPTLIDAYMGLASLYQDQERWDDAQLAYERGLAVAPTSGELLTEYGAFLLSRGDEEQGLALLDRAAQVGPTAAALTARAAVYAELGRVEDAIQDLQAALDKEPGHVDALLALGDLYREQDDPDSAQREYEEIVALTPGVAVGYLRLSALANEQGDEEEAERYLEAARQAEPGSLINPDDTQEETGD
jgi:tetratricopeptide (TPR) repeat protein